jgi:hypothetical protein
VGSITSPFCILCRSPKRAQRVKFIAKASERWYAELHVPHFKAESPCRSPTIAGVADRPSMRLIPKTSGLALDPDPPSCAGFPLFRIAD